MKYAFPANYGQNAVLVPIDAALVPIVAGALLHFQQRYYWLSEEDFEQGYSAFAELQAAMSGIYIRDLITAVNQVYRLVDTSLNGTAYTAALDGTVTPAIPAAPTSEVGAAPGLRRQLLDAQGEINEGWFGIGGQPATLADLVNALRIGSEGDTTRITEAIDQIAGDSLLAQGSQASNIFGTVSGLFADVVEAGGEGAILGTLIAASIATSGMLGVLAGQLDRLTTAIDGGGPIGPADNVLLALRGATEASETRNVIDAQSGAALAEYIDQIETLLTDIRTLLA